MPAGAWSHVSALAARPRAEPERDGVVELADACRFRGRDELVDEASRATASPPRASRRARSRASSSGGRRSTLAEGAVDECVVGLALRVELGVDERVHRAQAYS